MSNWQTTNKSLYSPVELIVEQDPEFKSCLRPLTAEELEDLRQKLAEDNCMEPFAYCVIQRMNLQLDGHHRRDICDELNIEYSWRKIDTVTSREQAISWIKRHQTGRRNLTEAEVRYLRGKQYLATKNPVGRPAENGDTDVTISPKAEEIAEKHGVTKRTVYRDAAIAKAIDARLCERCQRIGQASCENCRKMIQEPPPPETKPRKPRKPKQGRVLFDWPKFDIEFGKLVLQIDKLGSAYNAKDSVQAEALRRQLEQFRRDFAEWHDALTKAK